MAECGKSGIGVWVTAGKSIENYLPKNAVIEAFRSRGKSPVSEQPRDLGQYESFEAWLQVVLGPKGGLDKDYFSSLPDPLDVSATNDWLKRTRTKIKCHYSGRKPSFASEIAKRLEKEALEIHDLGTQLGKLAKAIRAANGLS